MLQNESKLAQGLQRSWHVSQGHLLEYSFVAELLFVDPKKASTPIWFVPCTSLSVIAVGQPKQLQKTTQYTRLLELETSKSFKIHVPTCQFQETTSGPQDRFLGWWRALIPARAFVPKLLADSMCPAHVQMIQMQTAEFQDLPARLREHLQWRDVLNKFVAYSCSSILVCWWPNGTKANHQGRTARAEQKVLAKTTSCVAKKWINDD